MYLFPHAGASTSSQQQLQRGQQPAASATQAVTYGTLDMSGMGGVFLPSAAHQQKGEHVIANFNTCGCCKYPPRGYKL